MSSGLRTLFAVATPSGDSDPHFTKFLADQPHYAPAMIDMAHLGSMLGGSFIPGIEVGREGGIATNWCLFDGATKDFPDVRFKFALKPDSHTIGTLTKDLAVPWSADFERCDETWWPTARLGMVTPDGITRVKWLIPDDEKLPHLGRKPANDAEYVKEYWKVLGFVRRDASDRFIEQEQTWRPAPAALPAVSIALTDTGASDGNLTSYAFPGKLLGAAASDRIVVVAVTTRGNAGPVTISSLRVSARNATERVAIANGNTRVSIWTALVVNGTSGEIVVNTSATAARCGISVYRMTGAPSATPFKVETANALDPLAALIDIPAKGGAIGVAHTNAASTFTWLGLTKDADFNAGGEAWRHSSAHDTFASAQLPKTVAADPTTANAQAMVVASWGWWT